MEWMNLITSLGQHVDLSAALKRDSDYKEYVDGNGRFAFVYQVALLVASVIVDLLERSSGE